MISSFWRNSTGAATDGRHPVLGDSAQATIAATTEPTTPSSREIVPYSKSDDKTSRELVPYLESDDKPFDYGDMVSGASLRRFPVSPAACQS